MNIKGCIFIALTLCLIVVFPNAQQNESINWHNPEKSGFHTIHNQLWNGSKVASYYDRLPAKAAKEVRKKVWNLSRNAAGLKLVFNTDATDITVRYVVSRKNYAMSHFPATGVSGVGLFAQNNDGTWAWANSSYQFKDTITYAYKDLHLDYSDYPNGREYHLYLPLYATVSWLEIGVPTKNSFEFIPPPADEKPIIVYGTSIAQGGCASRAGMAWTNILERLIHVPVVNLGFSSNGRLEKEVIDLIVENDARIFILDCLPNLGSAIGTIDSKINDAVHAIRASHPQTPIILADHAGYLDNRMNTSPANTISRLNEESWRAYDALKSEGVDHLYYLKHTDIGLDLHDSVDGTHPTDGGMLKYANAYEELIRIILEKEKML